MAPSRVRGPLKKHETSLILAAILPSELTRPGDQDHPHHRMDRRPFVVRIDHILQLVRSSWRLPVARHVPLAEAKARLSECVRDAERGDPVIITRHGKPAAALVRAADLQRLERLRAAEPSDGLAGLAGGRDGSEDLAEVINDRKRDRRTGRSRE